MKTETALDRWPNGKAFEKPKAIFRDDQEIARWVKRTVKEMDPIATDESISFRLPCFLIASSLIGPDHHRIANMLALPSHLVEQWAENLRRNGIWNDDKVYDDAWFDEKKGLVSFFLDSVTAEGLIERHLDSSGEAVYSAVPGRHLWDCN
jgi:hypothetical protein